MGHPGARAPARTGLVRSGGRRPRRPPGRREGTWGGRPAWSARSPA
jgi:hypothetical protein